MPSIGTLSLTSATDFTVIGSKGALALMSSALVAAMTSSLAQTAPTISMVAQALIRSLTPPGQAASLLPKIPGATYRCGWVIRPIP